MGPSLTPHLQIGKRGFREHGCLPACPLLPPYLGLGRRLKEGCQSLSGMDGCLFGQLAWGWLCSPSHNVAAPNLGQMSMRPNRKRGKEAGRRTTWWRQDPQTLLLSTASQFPEPINSLLPNVVWVGFLPPKKSRLIKHLIKWKPEYLTSSWLAPQAILFLRK